MKHVIYIIPVNVIATLTTAFHGFATRGKKTRNKQLAKNTIGIMMFTRIGLDISGCL